MPEPFLSVRETPLLRQVVVWVLQGFSGTTDPWTVYETTCDGRRRVVARCDSRYEAEQVVRIHGR